MLKLDKKHANLEQHPFGAIIPRMMDADYTKLKRSIKDHGYNPDHPVVLFQGKILDGKHRYQACKIALVPPVFREFEGDERAAIAYVISENLSRRNLTPSQAATAGADLALEMKKLDEGNKTANLQPNPKKKAGSNRSGKTGNPRKGKKTDTAAAAVGVSTRSVAAAEALKKSDPAAFEEVKAGNKSLNAATKDAAKKKAGETQATSAFSIAVETIEAAVPGLGKTASGKLTPKEVIMLATVNVDEIKRIRLFIEAGWKLHKALGYKSSNLEVVFPIKAALDRAMNEGGSYTTEIVYGNKSFKMTFEEIKE